MVNIYQHCARFILWRRITKPTAEKLAARFPTAHIYNTYGPTEATVAISAIEITQEVLKVFNVYQSGM